LLAKIDALAKEVAALRAGPGLEAQG
jgi:hypothetical protein